MKSNNKSRFFLLLVVSYTSMLFVDVLVSVDETRSELPS